MRQDMQELLQELDEQHEDADNQADVERCQQPTAVKYHHFQGMFDFFMTLGGTCVVDVLLGKPGSDRAHYGDIRTAFKRRLASRSTTDIENSPRYGH